MKKRGIVFAWEAYQFVSWSYRVSIVGAQLTATADLDHIQALVRMSKGFAQPQALHEDAAEIQSAAQEEVARAFSTYRTFVVTSACAAIETLWKATFVERALSDPSILARIDVQLSLNASDVIALSDEEKLFAVADELYKKSPNGRPRHKPWTHFERHRYLISDLLPLSPSERAEVQEWLESADEELFNEIFAVRNCLVHNGGIADRRPIGRGRFRPGEQIVLSPALVDEYLANLEYVGTAYVDMIGLGVFGDEGDPPVS